MKKYCVTIDEHSKVIEANNEKELLIKLLDGYLSDYGVVIFSKAIEALDITGAVYLYNTINEDDHLQNITELVEIYDIGN